MTAFARMLKERDLFEKVGPIATRHGCAVDELAGPARHKHIVAARRDVAGYLSRELGWSTTSIGKLLGRDHTTILNLLGRVGVRGRAPAEAT